MCRPARSRAVGRRLSTALAAATIVLTGLLLGGSTIAAGVTPQSSMSAADFSPPALGHVGSRHHPHRPVTVRLPGKLKPGKASVATFGPQPASATKPQARAYFTYAVTPGASLTDHVAVINYSLEPLTLSVYAADAVNTGNGGLGVQPQGQAPKDAGGWIALGTPGATGKVRVPARSASILPFKVRIPLNASPGDHTAGIVTQLSTLGTKHGEQVKLNQRVASRVFIRVSGPLHPKLSVEELHAKYHAVLNPFEAGSTTVSYTVRNTGNVDLAGHQRVSISGLFGGTATAPKLADVPLLLPGGSEHVSVTVRHTWPEIWMHAKVTIAPLTLPGAATGRLPDYGASTHFWAIPWVLIILVLLLLLGLGWFARRRWRARRLSSADTQSSTPGGPPKTGPRDRSSPRRGRK